jgi:hypothetical protein
MQEVPIVAVPVIVGINSIEAVHGEAPMITAIDRTGAVKTVHVVAPHTGMDASAHTAGFDGSDVSPANMTHTADVSAANATQPGDVSTAAESTDMGAATEAADVSASAEAADMGAATKAAAYSAGMAASATAATARLCLHSEQTHRQKGRRQNRYHSFHRFLHSIMDGAAV